MEFLNWLRSLVSKYLKCWRNISDTSMSKHIKISLLFKLGIYFDLPVKIYLNKLPW